MAPRVKPYRFTELERWTRSQLLVLQTFMAYLPGSGMGAEFKQQLRNTLSKLTSSEVDLWLDSITPARGPDVMRMLAEPACLAVVRFEPTPHQVLLDLDLKMAGIAVEKMLGGTGDDVDPGRPMSSIEGGLLAFVLLKLMHAAQQVLAEGQQVALRLKRIYGHASEVALLLGETDHVVLSFKVFLDMQVGYARLIMPSDMLCRDLAPPPVKEGPFFERRLNELRKALPRVAAVKTHLVVVAGRSELSEEDLAGVEVGDILLVEKTGVRKDGELLTGQVELRVAEGRHGVVHANLVELEGGGAGVEITSIEATPEPEARGETTRGEASPAGDEDGHTDDQSEDAMRTPLRPRNALMELQLNVRAFGDGARVRGRGGDALDEQVAGLMDREEHHEEDGESSEDPQGEEGAQDEGPADNLAQTEALLKDVAMPVVIELGRIKTTAADIVNLRPGQILELRRAPNDPVDITVNGKTVAKGELVEVEGELGVRLLSLTR
jgi:flagellar motor switch protein FliM